VNANAQRVHTRVHLQMQSQRIRRKCVSEATRLRICSNACANTSRLHERTRKHERECIGKCIALPDSSHLETFGFANAFAHAHAFAAKAFARFSLFLSPSIPSLVSLSLSLSLLCILYIYIYIYVHTVSRSYSHTHTHIHTHTRAHTQALREVGGWGRDPKKCTGRDWEMGSSTI